MHVCSFGALRLVNLIAKKRQDLSNTWQIIYHGTWYDFVNKYCEEAKKIYFFKTSPYSEHGIVMTINNADYAQKKADYLQNQLDKILTSNAKA